MLFRENFNSPPLKQPFLTFPTPHKQTSAKSHHSDFVSYQDIHAPPFNYSINDDERSETGVDHININQKRTNYLLEVNKQICRIKIEQDSRFLRQELWIKIETMFRKIWSYGQEFYEIIEKMIAKIEQNQEFYQTFEGKEALIYSWMLKNLEQQQGLYSKERMLRLNNLIIDQVAKYFQEVTDKYIDGLFHFSSELRGFKQNEMRSELLGQKQNNGQINVWEKIESKECKKQQNMRVREQYKSNEYFQSFYDQIRSNKLKTKTFRSENLNSKMYMPTQIDYKVTNGINYQTNGLNSILQTGKFIQPVRQRVERQQIQRSRIWYKEGERQIGQNSGIKNRKEGSGNRKSSSGNRKQKGGNISISRVISRTEKEVDMVKLDVEKVAYIVNENKQCLTSDWCQEVKISSQVKSKAVSINSTEPQISNNLIHNLKIVCTTFCNQFQHIAFGTTSSIIHVYDSSHYKHVTQLVGHRAPVCSLYENQGLLFSGADVGCCSIYIWDTHNWTARSKMCYHSAAVCCMINLPNTDYLLSCSLDKTVKLYDYKKFLITDHHSSQCPYTKMAYFEEQQRIAVSSPGTRIDILEIDLSKQDNQLMEKNGVMCSDKITAIQKARHGILVVGLQNGLLQLYHMSSANLFKRITVNKGPIMDIISFNRCHKKQFPILLFSCFGCRNFSLANTETQLITEVNVKGNVNVMMSNGIGPITVVNTRFELVWIDQEQPKFYSTTFSIH